MLDDVQPLVRRRRPGPSQRGGAQLRCCSRATPPSARGAGAHDHVLDARALQQVAGAAHGAARHARHASAVRRAAGRPAEARAGQARAAAPQRCGAVGRALLPQRPDATRRAHGRAGASRCRLPRAARWPRWRRTPGRRWRRGLSRSCSTCWRLWAWCVRRACAAALLRLHAHRLTAPARCAVPTEKLAACIRRPGVTRVRRERRAGRAALRRAARAAAAGQVAGACSLPVGAACAAATAARRRG
jgi:hypothetical protein